MGKKLFDFIFSKDSDEWPGEDKVFIDSQGRRYIVGNYSIGENWMLLDEGYDESLKRVKESLITHLNDDYIPNLSLKELKILYSHNFPH
jgi:hypothetical protein